MLDVWNCYDRGQLSPWQVPLSIRCTGVIRGWSGRERGRRVGFVLRSSSSSVLGTRHSYGGGGPRLEEVGGEGVLGEGMIQGAISRFSFSSLLPLQLGGSPLIGRVFGRERRLK